MPAFQSVTVLAAGLGEDLQRGVFCSTSSLPALPRLSWSPSISPWVMFVRGKRWEKWKKASSWEGGNHCCLGCRQGLVHQLWAASWSSTHHYLVMRNILVLMDAGKGTCAHEDHGFSRQAEICIFPCSKETSSFSRTANSAAAGPLHHSICRHCAADFPLTSPN